MKPGKTRAPFASMVCFVKIGPFGMRGRPSPTATMVSPLTITYPFSITRRSTSIVTTVPPVIRRSTKLAGLGCACSCAEILSAPMQTIAAQANTMAFPLFAIRFGFIFFPRLSQVGRIERFRKQIAHLDSFGFTLQIGKDYGDIAAKFPDQLAACAAGRRERVVIRDDGNGVKVAFAFAHGFKDRYSFGADRQS